MKNAKENFPKPSCTVVSLPLFRDNSECLPSNADLIFDQHIPFENEEVVAVPKRAAKTFTPDAILLKSREVAKELQQSKYSTSHFEFTSVSEF